MIQIRYNLFETNSSSACTLIVVAFKPDSIHIPKTIRIDSRGDEKIDIFYRCSGFADSDTRDFVAFLYDIGVEEVYVDGEIVDLTDYNANIPIDKDILVARLFAAECEEFFDYHSWGDEMEDSPTGITLKDKLKIQEYKKNPSYTVLLEEGGTNKEIAWEDSFLSQPVPQELIDNLAKWEKEAERRKQLEIEREEEWKKYRIAYMEKYGIDPDEFDKISEEADTEIDPVSNADEYFEKLQEKMIQKAQKKRRK